MNIAPYIPLAGFFVNIFFALFVYSRAPHLPANRVYLLLGISIAVWNAGSYHLFIVSNHDDALFWARFLQFGCIFGVVAFFHLSLIVAGISSWRWMRWLYLLELGLALTNFTPLFIKDVRYLGHSGWYAVAGPAFHVFNVPFSLMFGSIFVLLKKMRTMPRMQRRRLIPLLCSQALLAVLGTNDVLPINGIDEYPIIHVKVYPWGSLAAVFYGIITAYSVIQHELLNIQAGLSRYAALFIRFAFMVSIMLGLMLGVQAAFGSFDRGSFIAAFSVFVISAVTATLLFPRLFGGKGLENWEHRILGDRFEYQDRIRAFTESVVWHNDINPLTDGLHELFTGAFRFQRYWLILRDDTLRAFMLTRAYPEEPLSAVPELKVPSPVFTFFETNEDHQWLNLGKDQQVRRARPLERQAREQLTRFPAEFAFPLRWENELFGLILVGNKLDEEPITNTDLTLLTDLTRRLSLVFNQIRLKDEVLRTQELELLGRMSRGMAHDLNNLLTPIWTLLQLASEGHTDERFDEELLAVALRNTQTVRAYIKEALFFSEHLRPDLQLGRLDMLIAQAVELARTNRKKDVQITALTPGEVLVEMDEVLLQRLLGNLISNAIDASQPGTEVRVELERLVKTEAARDWLRVRVIDQGEGIPKENLERVMTPYFTTKNRGDEGRGFGLGLSICRKIAALHGGQLTIRSQLKKGTTVQIDLPTRQNKPNHPVIASAA